MTEFEKLADRVRNWGRWGPDDELGTLNLVTPQRRAEAAKLARRGRVFSLSLPFQADGPMTGGAGRTNPAHLMMASGVDPEPLVALGGGCRYTDDFIAMPLQCSTQWDSLAHVYYGDQLYNGYPASAVDSFGAHRNGIEKSGESFVSRGVLLDIARLKGVDCLDGTYVITTEDLDRAEDYAGTKVGQGDVVMLRTGIAGTRQERGWAAYRTSSQAGVHWDTAEWFHDRDVAAVASDNNAVEAVGITMRDLMVPFHMLAIRDMGMPLGEMWDLETLAEDCAADGVCEVLLVAAPLLITGAVGSPINPLAVK